MESVTILSSVRKATGHLKERLIKTYTRFLAGCEDEIKMATTRGVSSTQGLGHLTRVETDKEIQSTESPHMVIGKTHDITKLVNPFFWKWLLRESLRLESFFHGPAYSAIHSLKVLSYEQVAISCPSEEMSRPITLPSWPARVFSGDQPGWVQILAVLS